MTIIDTHVHIWTHDGASPLASEATCPPVYNAHPEPLLQLMQANGVESAVLVQYIGYRWDNTYVAQALKARPDKFMAVCRVDPEDPAAPEQLSYWTEVHGFRGVRLSPEPDARGDWFAGPLMEPLFRQAADLEVPVVILTKPSRLPELVNILEQVPNVVVVIDHFADSVDGGDLSLEILSTLAEHPRVFLKTGHIWMHSAQGYPWHDTLTWIQRLCEVFGAERIVWGSDWPFSLHRATYSQSLSCLRDATDVFSEEDLAWILGGTALRLWPFPHLAGRGRAPLPGATS